MTTRTLALNRAFAFLTVAGLAAYAAAHPHFNKTITYNTTPANETRATSAPLGVFTSPRNPKLKLSADLKAGEKVLAPAGEYIIGVIKNSETDWTMALYNGVLARGAAPDPTKIIKLESSFNAKIAPAEHMLIDITPGHGKFEGKAVLTLHFGTLFLSGLLG